MSFFRGLINQLKGRDKKIIFFLIISGIILGIISEKFLCLSSQVENFKQLLLLGSIMAVIIGGSYRWICPLFIKMGVDKDIAVNGIFILPAYFFSKNFVLLNNFKEGFILIVVIFSIYFIAYIFIFFELIYRPYFKNK